MTETTVSASRVNPSSSKAAELSSDPTYHAMVRYWRQTGDDTILAILSDYREEHGADRLAKGRTSAEWTISASQRTMARGSWKWQDACQVRCVLHPADHLPDLLFAAI